MKKTIMSKLSMAAVLAITVVAELCLTVAANTRCWYIYHDDKLPDGINEYRRF